MPTWSASRITRECTEMAHGDSLGQQSSLAARGLSGNVPCATSVSAYRLLNLPPPDACGGNLS